MRDRILPVSRQYDVRQRALVAKRHAALTLFNPHHFSSQVEAELQYPQLPYLESVTADKALLVTQYVLREFVSIVSVVGGEEEQARAERVLKRCW